MALLIDRCRENNMTMERVGENVCNVLLDGENLEVIEVFTYHWVILDKRGRLTSLRR